MPVTVYRLPDENILVATFTGVVDGDLLLQMYEASDALLEEMQPPVVRISDFRTVTSTPEAVLDAYLMATSDVSASTTDQRIVPMLVGDNRWSRLAKTMLTKSRKRDDMTIFDNMGEATRQARAILVRLQQDSNNQA